ncbi:MAG: hypothetical protein FWB75_07975 [Oscillospiraceae bacterium]|nr:hypothetical protein [Oscillospiraceae bacterium]
MPSTLKCTNCGGDLEFTPHLQQWKCEWCDKVHTKEDLEGFTPEAKEALGDTVQVEERREVTDEGVTVTYKCSYCGAEVITTEETAQTFCCYCQRPVTILSQVSGEFKPAVVLPFRLIKEDALTQFKNFLQGKRFLPDAYCGEKNIEKLSGIYVPFWLYDATMHFDFAGEGDIVTSSIQGDFKVIRTDTFQVLRKGSFRAENIPVDASIKIPDDIMDSIEPYKYEDLKPFATPYLSGFMAQRFDVSKDDCFPRANARMEGSADIQIDATLGRYSTVRRHKSTKNAQHVQARYALLPVWMLYSTFEGEDYIFAMNGQTGKMLGNLPMDKAKMIKFGLLVFLLSGAGSALLGFALRALGFI